MVLPNKLVPLLILAWFGVPNKLFLVWLVAGFLLAGFGFPNKLVLGAFFAAGVVSKKRAPDCSGARECSG